MSSPAVPAAGRNPLIDVARALSVLVVVLFHMFLFQVRWVDGGMQAGVVALGHWAWYGSWVIQVMPLFFLAGGFAHARVIDRMRVEGTSYGRYLATRGARLLGPLGFFVAAVSLVTSVTAWLVDFDLGTMVGRLLARVLWFMAVYIVIVLLAPTMVRLHDRVGMMVPVVLGLVAVAIDVVAVQVGPIEWRWANLVFVWLACHQLGIGFERGWLRSTPQRSVAWWLPVLAGVAGVAVLVALLRTGWYPPTAVGLGDHPESNLSPPAATMLALCFVQLCVLALLDRRRWPRLETERFRTALGWLNAMLVTIYLWHVSVIGLTKVLLLVPIVRWPESTRVLTVVPVYVVLAVPLLIWLVPRIARIELRLIPAVGARQNTLVCVLATLVLLAGTFCVWWFGTVLHPDAIGSTLGVLLVATGSWLLAVGGNRPVPR